MNMEQVEGALTIGHKVAYGEMARSTTVCEFARGVEMTLRKMAQASSFPKSWIINWVADWVKDWTDEKRCP